uniref:Ig-like domain-containing protein n=1 Tax=Poecilia reticulata TaxID=8081 RepID=A0A3P9N9R8_POERE
MKNPEISMVIILLGGIKHHHQMHHSLQYIYTASTGINSFPDFVAVGLVDGTEVMYYDSDIRKAIPKQDWMRKVTEDDPQYWDFQSQGLYETQMSFINSIEVAKKRLNQSRGVHIFQNMYGCEIDDEYERVEGWESFGYDGEDFIAFDLKTERWSAPVHQAFITKNKWDYDKMKVAETKNYITQTCPAWLKKYLKYGKNSLVRTDHPSVYFLQKSSSSQVSCHATGFYPSRAEMFWRKDGEEIHEDVNKGEILPNNDGTFQMRVDLDLSSISSDDWMRYECVFQLSGLKEDLVTKLEKEKIRTNKKQCNCSVLLSRKEKCQFVCSKTNTDIELKQYSDLGEIFFRFPLKCIYCFIVLIFLHNNPSKKGIL